MSLLDEFQENTEIFNARKNQIDQEAFDALIQKHGVDFARGYLKALQEMNDIVGNIFNEPEIHKTITGEEYRFSASQATVYGKLWHLHKALYSFAENNGLAVDTLTRPINHGTKTQSF